MFRQVLFLLGAACFTANLLYGQGKVSSGDHIVPEIVLVEGGTFTMGCRNGEIDEEPPHDVTISNFYIGRYEVTNRQYATFLNYRRPSKKEVNRWLNVESRTVDIKRVKNKFEVEEIRADYPVSGVSWYGANAYCDWLRAMTGEPFRLPTEAEWEYAAKGGRKAHGYTYSGSPRVDEVAWLDWTADGEKQIVGQLKPNELTLHDMNGNVQEWCNDWYAEDYYAISDDLDPTGPEEGKEVVVRGGAYHLDIEVVRNEDRSKFPPVLQNITIGFRIARDYGNGEPAKRQPEAEAE